MVVRSFILDKIHFAILKEFSIDYLGITRRIILKMYLDVTIFICTLLKRLLASMVINIKLVFIRDRFNFSSRCLLCCALYFSMLDIHYPEVYEHVYGAAARTSQTFIDFNPHYYYFVTCIRRQE